MSEVGGPEANSERRTSNIEHRMQNHRGQKSDVGGQSPRFRLGELYSSQRRLRPLAKRSEGTPQVNIQRRTSNIEYKGGAAERPGVGTEKLNR